MGTDKQLIKERFEASFGRYNRLAIVQQRICSQLAKRVGGLRMTGIHRALEIGAGTGFLTSRLVDAYPDAEWHVNDLVPAAGKYLAGYLADVNSAYLWGDAEELVFPENLDLIASASTVQWFDDMEAFVQKCAASTVSGGLLAVATFGKENFREIRETTGEGLEYMSAEELCGLSGREGYKIISAEEYTETLFFDMPLDVLHHIRATGVNSLSKAHWTRRQLMEFSESYKAAFTSGDGKVGLTYHPILIVAEKL